MPRLSLPAAKKRATLAFDQAKTLVRDGHITARNASRDITDIFWGLYHRLPLRDRPAFDAWFRNLHDKTGKDLGLK